MKVISIYVSCIIILQLPSYVSFLQLAGYVCTHIITLYIIIPTVVYNYMSIFMTASNKYLDVGISIIFSKSTESTIRRGGKSSAKKQLAKYN